MEKIKSIDQELLEMLQIKFPDTDVTDVAIQAWESCQDHGLGFEVEKIEMKTPEGWPSGIYCTRKEGSKDLFGEVGKGYMIFQNINLFLLSYMVANQLDCKVHSAGSMLGGCWPYVQLDMGQIEGIGKNNDTVQQFASVLTSHDRTYSLKWGYSDLTISCFNTFKANERILGRQNSVKHTLSMVDKIKESLKKAEEIRKGTEKMVEIYARLDETPVQKKHIDWVTEILTGVDMEEDDLDDLSLKTVNKMNAVKEVITQEIDQKGSTLWGLWNGATYYSTWTHGNDPETRQKHKMTGYLMREDNNILEGLNRFSKN